MRIEVTSEAFKKVLDRVDAVCPKNPTIFTLRWIRISAMTRNTIYVSACNCDSAATVSVDGDAVDTGEAVVDIDDAKKLCNTKGNIVIETKGNQLVARSDKKKSYVFLKDETCLPEFPSVGTDNLASKADKKEMIESLLNVYRSAEKNSTNMMDGIHFAGDRIEALDGHRIAIKYVDWNSSDLNMTIPGYSIGELKKVSANKEKDDVVQVFKNDKFARFEGSDFVYICRLLDGIFFDVKKVIGDWHEEFSIWVDAEEFTDVAKTYKKELKSDSNRGMYMHLSDDELSTVLLLPHYCTSDKLMINYIEGYIPQDFVIRIRPEYIADATEILDGIIKIEFKDRVSPRHIVDNDYRFVILPVAMGDSDCEKVKEYLEIS